MSTLEGVYAYCPQDYVARGTTWYKCRTLEKQVVCPDFKTKFEDPINRPYLLGKSEISLRNIQGRRYRRTCAPPPPPPTHTFCMAKLLKTNFYKQNI